MSQLSFSSFDDALLVRDAQGRYSPASVDQILEAARQAIELKMHRGAEFTSPAMVKEYLRNKLAGFEHEVFAVLFLDTRHRLIEYREMFHGTIDSASVYPREVVKEALRFNAAAVILAADDAVAFDGLLAAAVVAARKLRQIHRRNVGDLGREGEFILRHLPGRGPEGPAAAVGRQKNAVGAINAAPVGGDDGVPQLLAQGAVGVPAAAQHLQK